MVNQGNLGIILAFAVYMDRIRAEIRRMTELSNDILEEVLIHLSIRYIRSEDYLCAISRGPEYAGLFCIRPDSNVHRYLRNELNTKQQRNAYSFDHTAHWPRFYYTGRTNKAVLHKILWFIYSV